MSSDTGYWPQLAETRDTARSRGDLGVTCDQTNNIDTDAGTLTPLNITAVLRFTLQASMKVLTMVIFFALQATVLF